MQLDLNLLIALDALLEEESVGGAATRLHLSAPAMSRTLGRIRRALGDPVLVRAGRTMVPTPRAVALRTEVRALVRRAQALLAPEGEPDLTTLDRTFTIQANDAVVASIGARLLSAAHAAAPHVTIRMRAEAPADTADLREGRVDLEIGVIGEPAPEVHREFLLTDRIVGVVRAGHPLTAGRMTAARFAAGLHLVTSRRGRLTGPIDTALADLGLTRRVLAAAPTYATSLMLLPDSDLVGSIAGRLCRPAIAALGLHTFPLPLELPALEISQAWHPRYDADGAHRWLRGLVREAFTDLDPATP
ncbi:LysR family transcriptional regulator [Longispora fulva]|uniref:DNA-binding transcriptional LysR family regulator n=1 Tax=Longispora fulva TaxID=619741 RepID=A0A8J7GI40_9ACTN|nr:LysR family transcriptional regulator [Longispora fulva]MBG6137075.1 DNA-binding transcriptional LysR family regulator [Longispora fulva]GIG61571.1 LysR family transcriptional regulator [Longispora fulva]